jgi:cytochrome c
MNIRYLVILAAASILAGNAFADGGAALAQSHNCMMCHSVDQKKLGPAFKDVAAKYKDDKSAPAMLEKKVRNGGGGTWGKMPMPAAAQSVSDSDIKSIVQWVLSLK